MTDLEQRLREALHEDADRARLVNPDRPPVPDARPLLEPTSARRSPRKLVAVAAAIVLIAATGVAVIQDRGDGPDVDTAPVVFADVQPGSTVALPAAPFAARAYPAMVWSGHEMVVWGGRGADEEVLDDGAAFDPEAGTWRIIAPAPIDARELPLVAWTGSEMVVLGGFRFTEAGTIEVLRDGAAYDPSSDTWRRLPEVPIDANSDWGAVWTGDELIVLGSELSAAGLEQPRAVAYRPDANEWRRLADPPAGSDTVVWTGEALLLARAAVPEVPDVFVRYVPQTDEWETVAAASYASLVAVPGAGGAVETVLALPTERNEPVSVLDRMGRQIGTLPGHPGDVFAFGEVIQAGQGYPYADGGTWLGDEAVFWIRAADQREQLPEPWGLDPATGTWRSLGAGAPSFGTHLELVADAGVLIGWGPAAGQDAGASTGIVYRPPGLGDDVGPPFVQPSGLPEPGEEQPADVAAAEAEVRAAFVGVYDFSSTRPERAHFSQRPAVYSEANRQLMEGQYGELVADMQAEVEAVVFTDSTHASVQYRFTAASDQVPKGPFLGEAVLEDGRWLVAITTTCERVSIAGVTCDMSL